METTDEWIKKYIHTNTHTHTHTHTIYTNTMEYYSVLKKNEMVPCAATWMDLKIIRLNEVGQKKKDKYHIAYMQNLKYETN